MSVAYYSFYKDHPHHLNYEYSRVSSPAVLNSSFSNVLIDIHVSCFNLPKFSQSSSSNYMVVLFILINGEFQEVSRTEVIHDDQSPSFSKSFRSIFLFEILQPFLFKIYNVEFDDSDLSKHDFIGQVEAELHNLLLGASQRDFLLTKDGVNLFPAKFTIQYQKTKHSNEFVSATLSLSGLKRLQTFRQNNPFITISKPSGKGTPIMIYRSEVIPKARQCSFKKFSIPYLNFCNNEKNLPLIIEIFDFSSTKPPKLIDSCEDTPLNILKNEKKQLSLKNSEGVKVGSVSFVSVIILPSSTFFDYLKAGIQFNLITAIDFTASNKLQHDPTSLHFYNPSSPNQYERCLMEIGSVLCSYNQSQLFPVYGFGAKIHDVVHHCFPLNFNDENPFVQNLDEILRVYRSAVTKVILHGPTLFTPIIETAATLSKKNFETNHTYSILLILTDGVLNDIGEAIDAIVAASFDAPLSIIIVGVGPSNFKSMVEIVPENKILQNFRELLPSGKLFNLFLFEIFRINLQDL